MKRVIILIVKKKIDILLKNNSGKLFLLLFSIAVILTALHLFMQYLNLNVYKELNLPIYEITNRLDLDDEVSIGSWFAQFLFVIFASLSLFTAYLQKQKSNRRLWMVIGVGALIISIDEGSGLHEMFLQAIHINLFSYEAPTALHNAWWVVLPFVAVFGAWLLYRMYKMLDNKTVLLAGGAMLLFVVGAVFVDQATSVANTTNSGFNEQGISVAVEEFFEMTAAIIVIYAVANYLERNYSDRISKAVKALK